MSADDLSEAQKAEYKTFFDKYASGDSMPAKKLSSAIRALGFNVKQNELAKYFGTIEDGVMGSLDIDKFYVVMAMKLQNDDNPADILAAFKAFDPDSDSMAEPRFKAIMTQMGAKLTNEEVNELLKEVSVGGQVNFEKLIKVVMG